MPYALAPFRDINLDESLLRALLDEHDRHTLPQLRRLWAYYRNPVVGPAPADPFSTSAQHRRPRLAQESGLPARFQSPARRLPHDDRAPSDKEVVIENDIAWRVHAMTDAMLGGPVSISSLARDPATRHDIERLLDTVLEASGGAALLHDMALLGAVFGSIDLLLRADPLFATTLPAPATHAAPIDRALALAHLARVELVDPTRAVPLTAETDYRRLDALLLRYTRQRNDADAAPPQQLSSPTLSRRLASLGLRSRSTSPTRATVQVLEILSATHHQTYENGRLIDEAPNPLGLVPSVHIQNLSQPFQWLGLSEVEPLIPLQDELNTRLSDRAARVTLQSFRMYLAKGVEGFADAPVGPGTVWSTDNPDASITPITGDAASPSEDAHIEELREAMDKISAVTPVAAGVLRARLGALSSENALRVTLLGLLAKTRRKHLAYGRGLSSLCSLILHAFDAAGLYHTDPADRAVRVNWPDPFPDNPADRLDAALKKASLGVPTDRLLAELGYAPADPGLT